MSRPILLASTSPYRRTLLERLGIPFESVASAVDESIWQAAGLEPVELAARLAREKARVVFESFPDRIVIGSDQVASIDGEILTKPGTPERAVVQLQKLAGRTHQLDTAVCVWAEEGCFEFVESTRLTMADLSREALERYVAQDDPVDCAGAYKIEALGISLFDRLETSDPTAIVGLPLMFVAKTLRQLGVRIP
jgi:septum formation protein